jgi:hypothetical protein
MYLSKVAKTWSGPISLTIFVPDIEFDFATKFIQHLIHCDPWIMEKVSLHLIYPVEKPPKHVPMTEPILARKFNCTTNTAKILADLFDTATMKA